MEGRLLQHSVEQVTQTCLQCCNFHACCADLLTSQKKQVTSQPMNNIAGLNKLHYICSPEWWKPGIDPD
jgi:hypothetical protein